MISQKLIPYPLFLSSKRVSSQSETQRNFSAESPCVFFVLQLIHAHTYKGSDHVKRKVQVVLIRGSFGFRPTHFRQFRPTTKQWKKEQVWPFFGCCTADSQTEAGRYQLYNNGSLVRFSTACFRPTRYHSCSAFGQNVVE